MYSIKGRTSKVFRLDLKELCVYAYDDSGLIWEFS